jgi:hypothetical protein
VVDLGRKLAGALELAHRDGIVHRDVKPGNILLRADGEPALADFGLSIRPAHDHSQGLDALAPEYAAPESLRDGEYDAACDIYALGATLYALIEATPPFPHRRGEAPLGYLMRAVNDPVPPLRRADVPEPLRALVTRMLDKDPGRRPDAAGVAAALSAVRVSGGYAPAPPPSGPPVTGDDRTGIRTPPPFGTPTPAGTPAPAGTPPPGAALDGQLTGVRSTAQVPPPVPARRVGRRARLATGVAAGVALLGAAGVVGGWLLGGAPAAVPHSGPAPTTSPAGSGPPVVLAEPTDDGSSVRLRWSADAGLQYAVIVGEQDRAPRTVYVSGRTSATVPVAPGAPYCFQVQATRGGPVLHSNVRSIRGAICDF